MMSKGEAYPLERQHWRLETQNVQTQKMKGVLGGILKENQLFFCFIRLYFNMKSDSLLFSFSLLVFG